MNDGLDQDRLTLSSAFAEAKRLRECYFELDLGVDARVVALEGPVEEVLGKLVQFAHYDQQNERIRDYFATLTSRGWPPLLAGVGGIILGLIMTANASAFGILVVVVAVWIFLVALVWVVTMGREKARLAGCDVPDDLGRFVIPLLRVLREDMEPGGYAKIRMDVRRVERPDNRVSSESKEPPAGSRALSLEESHYVARVFLLEAQLRGRGKLDCELQLLRRRRAGRKRNARGNKIKHYVKLRDRVLLQVRLALPRKIERASPGDLTKLQVKHAEKRDTLVVRQRYATTLPGWSELEQGIELQPRDLRAMLLLIGEAFGRFAASG